MDHYLLVDIVELFNTYVPKKERSHFAAEFASLIDMEEVPSEVIDHIRTLNEEIDTAFADIESENDDEDGEDDEWD